MAVTGPSRGEIEQIFQKYYPGYANSPHLSILFQSNDDAVIYARALRYNSILNRACFNELHALMGFQDYASARVPNFSYWQQDKSSPSRPEISEDFIKLVDQVLAHKIKKGTDLEFDNSQAVFFRLQSMSFAISTMDYILYSALEIISAEFVIKDITNWIDSLEDSHEIKASLAAQREGMDQATLRLWLASYLAQETGETEYLEKLLSNRSFGHNLSAALRVVGLHQNETALMYIAEACIVNKQDFLSDLFNHNELNDIDFNACFQGTSISVFGCISEAAIDCPGQWRVLMQRFDDLRDLGVLKSSIDLNARTLSGKRISELFEENEKIFNLWENYTAALSLEFGMQGLYISSYHSKASQSSDTHLLFDSQELFSPSRKFSIQ